MKTTLYTTSEVVLMVIKYQNQFAAYFKILN